MMLGDIGAQPYCMQTFGISVFKILANTGARIISVHTMEQLRNGG